MESKLERAFRHAARGSEIVAAQRERVANLREAGADTTEAENLLRRFEGLQAIFEEDLAYFLGKGGSR